MDNDRKQDQRSGMEEEIKKFVLTVSTRKPSSDKSSIFSFFFPSCLSLKSLFQSDSYCLLPIAMIISGLEFPNPFHPLTLSLQKLSPSYYLSPSSWSATQCNSFFHSHYLFITFRRFRVGWCNLDLYTKFHLEIWPWIKILLDDRKLFQEEPNGLRFPEEQFQNISFDLESELLEDVKVKLCW